MVACLHENKELEMFCVEFMASRLMTELVKTTEHKPLDDGLKDLLSKLSDMKFKLRNDKERLDLRNSHYHLNSHYHEHLKKQCELHTVKCCCGVK